MGKCCKKWQNKSRVLNLFFKISVFKGQIINKTCASVIQACNRLLSKASCVSHEMISLIFLHKTNQRLWSLWKPLRLLWLRRGSALSTLDILNYIRNFNPQSSSNKCIPGSSGIRVEHTWVLAFVLWLTMWL